MALITQEVIDTEIGKKRQGSPPVIAASTFLAAFLQEPQPQPTPYRDGLSMSSSLRAAALLATCQCELNGPSPRGPDGPRRGSLRSPAGTVPAETTGFSK